MRVCGEVKGTKCQSRDQKGWNEDLAAQALQCLSKAQAKEALNPKVVAARELYRRTSRKYGIDVVPLGAGR